MRIKSLVLLSVFAFVSNIAFAAKTTTVQGQDNIAVDRPAVQSAINAAGSGDTIKLVGTFQFDGTRIVIQKSNLSIVGAGAAGNWSTLIKGITNAGVPVGDNPNGAIFNRGFNVGPSTTTISKLQIQGIKFIGFNRTVVIQPSFQGNSTNCADTTISQGAGQNIDVSNNWFDNDLVGVQIEGSNSHIGVSSNLFSEIINRGVVVVGTIATCTPFPPGFELVGVPTFIDITGNTVQNDSSVEPIIVLSAENVTISGNTVSNSNNFVPIVVQGIINSTVSNNTVEGGADTLSGIFAETIIGADPSWPVQVEPIKNSKIINNQIKNTPVAVVVDNDVSTLSVINNRYVNSSVTDVWLCDSTADDNNFCDFFFPEFGSTPPSSNNKVVTTNFSNTVVNHGTNNMILGTQNLLNNPNVPDSVKDRLKDHAIGRPPVM